MVEVVRANLTRAIVIALLVGTALILINHGDHLLEEPICDGFMLKCALSYVVPFLVSMSSAVMAARERTNQSL